MPKAINKHSYYVIFAAFPLQQWLRERALMLVTVHCLSCSVSCTLAHPSVLPSTQPLTPGSFLCTTNQVSPHIPVSSILFCVSVVITRSIHFLLCLPLFRVLSGSHSSILHRSLFHAIFLTYPNHCSPSSFHSTYQPRYAPSTVQ